MKHYHFIGIGGIGMGALASIVLAKGNKVTGSDLRDNKITRRLIEEGAKVHKGHAALYVEQADVVVVSTAIDKENPELLEAGRKKIPVIHRGELLAGLMHGYTGITVSGAHGKTTTSSMAAQMLVNAGLNPTAAIGGIIQGETSNARFGSSEFFVSEADESDGSFLHLSPRYSIITNVDLEHLDYYGNWQGVSNAYSKFISKTQEGGLIIANGDDERLVNLLRGHNVEYTTFGFSSDNDIYAKDIRFDRFLSSFDCVVFGESIGQVSLKIPGKYNILNALACIRLGIALRIDKDIIFESIANFSGAQRRFQLLGDIDEIKVIDDYAHHPTEIKAVIEAAKAGQPDSRLIVAFQPHRYTRLKSLWGEFSNCFNGCDHLIVTEVYPASEKPVNGITAENFAEYIKNNFTKPIECLKKEDIVSNLLKLAKPGDLVMMLGAGDITGIASNFVDALNENGFLVEKFGKVGVLMGGYSNEREISLKSGKAILKALKAEGCRAVGIDIVDRDVDKIMDVILSEQIDTAFIALHGKLGEDGVIQTLLEKIGIPYTGSGIRASKLAINKIHTQKSLEVSGLYVPSYRAVNKNHYEGIDNLISRFSKFPVVVKPATEGSSIGVTIARDKSELEVALDIAWQYSDELLIEEFIKGREMTVGILDDRPLPVIEIIAKNEFFDFEAKYQKGKTDYIVPAVIPNYMSLRLQNIALRAHRALGCKGLSRVDFIVDNKNVPYVLEVNTIPGFTETSLLPRAAEAIGINFNQLCLTILGLTNGKKKEIPSTAVTY
ncbi:MAG: UDP-N-acetylmuramate--L-alanine ligase [Candidatus Omnitrophica bacterium]|nr:UDP-N-acetylmuramate--L-alanine ligase [Candidatus Omnitrophota bacterium]